VLEIIFELPPIGILLDPRPGTVDLGNVERIRRVLDIDSRSGMVALALDATETVTGFDDFGVQALLRSC
jgi:hypothetical protein